LLRRIVNLEPDPDKQKVMAALARRCGFMCQCAADQAELLDMLKQVPDIVMATSEVINVQFGSEMDLIELIRMQPGCNEVLILLSGCNEQSKDSFVDYLDTGGAAEVEAKLRELSGITAASCYS
jgi:CheY-like chemotaxis protein